MKTLTVELKRDKIAMNTAMTFSPKAPKGYKLSTGVVTSNMGAPTGMRIRDDGTLSVTISGATRPGLKVHLVGVFVKVPAPVENLDAGAAVDGADQPPDGDAATSDNDTSD